MTVTPSTGIGAILSVLVLLLAVLVLLLAILGLLHIVSFTAPVVFGLLAALALAYLIGARWA